MKTSRLIGTALVVAALGASLCACSDDDDTYSPDNSVSGTLNGHDYVDLGLSVKWAACNVGASSPSDYGGYFAWGETSEKEEYTIGTCVTYGMSIGSIEGDPEYDAARANWGGTWRLPTADEIDELMDGCRQTWTSYEGREGYMFTGSNGRSIFLPAAGWRGDASLNYAGEYGDYWSATPDSYANYAHELNFSYTDCGGYPNFRYRGLSVRPVSE